MGSPELGWARQSSNALARTPMRSPELLGARQRSQGLVRAPKGSQELPGACHSSQGLARVPGDSPELPGARLSQYVLYFLTLAKAPFSSSTHKSLATGVPCLDEELAFATTPNRQKMRQFIDQITAGGTSHYSYGVNFARYIFTRTASQDIPSERDQERLKIMMFISDGEPSDTERQVMEAMQKLVNSGHS